MVGTTCRQMGVLTLGRQVVFYFLLGIFQRKQQAACSVWCCQVYFANCFADQC